MASSIDFGNSIQICPDSWNEFLNYYNGIYGNNPMNYIIPSDGGFICFINIGTSSVVIYKIYSYDTDIPGIDKEDNNSEYTDFSDNYMSLCNTKPFYSMILNDWEGFRDYNKVRSREELLYTNTQSGVNPTIINTSFPYRVGVVCGKIFPYWSHYEIGDKFSAGVLPPNNGLIGVITANALSGQKEIYASDTVIDNVMSGYDLKIGTEDYYYRITSIDRETKKITLVDNLNQNKNTSDLIYLYICFIDNIPISKSESGYMLFGNNIFGSSMIPVNYTFRAKILHKTTPTYIEEVGIVGVYHYGE